MTEEATAPQREVDWSRVDDHPVIAATFGIVQGNAPHEVVLTFGYTPPPVRLAVEAMDEEQFAQFLKDNPMRPTNVVRISLPKEGATALAQTILAGPTGDPSNQEEGQDD